MSHPPLRIVHSGDFHLEQPLGGVAEVPDHLRELFLDAPYQAASQVFETVLSEKADALLLSGDLVDVERAGPRAVVFLQEHFQRLADHGIPVFWATGQCDSIDSWPPCAELPDNVCVFAVGKVENQQLRRGDQVLARIQGISHRTEKAVDQSGFHRDAHGVFTVGVAYDPTVASATSARVNYLALGGRHRRQAVEQSPGSAAHYCGSPQGRRPEEVGPCGCTVLAVDETGNIKTSFVATDAVRWLREVVEVTAGTDEDSLLDLLEQRITKVKRTHAGREVLVTWEIQGHGQLLNHIRRGGISDTISDLLRDRHGKESPGVWTVDIECHAPLEVPQEWVDAETIMGELLRDFHNLEQEDTIPLELEEFLPPKLRKGQFAELALVSPEERTALLCQASKLGVDLLDGEEQLTA